MSGDRAPFPLRLEKTYQLFDDLGDEQFQGLKADILARGVLVDIEVDEDGLVLDGHQRARAVLALQAEGHRPRYGIKVRAGLTEDDKWAHSISMNFQRRQLNMIERRALAAEIRRRFAWSTGRIGAILGVNQSTVVRWLDGVSGLPEHVVGEDGRTYRSAVWGAVTATSDTVTDALRAAQTLGAHERSVDVRRALVLARQARLEDKYVELPPDHPARVAEDARIDGAAMLELRIGPLTEALADLPDASVDLVLTDPPYPHEFLPQWDELGALARRVLKPGRLLVAYCGHRWLNRCWDALSAHLEYAWLGGMFFGGAGPSVHDRRIFSGWRPILMFSNGDWVPHRWTKDAWYGEGAEKDLHPWQQSVGTFLELIEAHTDAGQVVVDPFLGSGTTAVAASRLGRRFVGCDVDEGAVNVATRRLGF